jgi:aspartyl-tRNA(Asn)/glutamyl-tRNA(Gln) amidotransferase subunit A
LKTRGAGFGPEVKRRIMLGTYALSAGYYDAYYLKAQKVRTLIKADFDAVWAAGFDAICAPTSPTVAFKLGAKVDDPVAMYLSDTCTLPLNMAGLPGISIPAGLSEGLPVGLQLIGSPWSELSMLRLARAYEGITARAPWRDLDPAELSLTDDPSTPSPMDRNRANAAGNAQDAGAAAGAPGGQA